MVQTDKCVVAQGLKVVLIINLITIDHSRMIQAFRFIKISKYDDGGQIMPRSSTVQYFSESVTFQQFISIISGFYR